MNFAVYLLHIGQFGQNAPSSPLALARREGVYFNRSSVACGVRYEPEENARRILERTQKPEGE